MECRPPARLATGRPASSPARPLAELQTTTIDDDRRRRQTTDADRRQRAKQYWPIRRAYKKVTTSLVQTATVYWRQRIGRTKELTYSRSSCLIIFKCTINIRNNKQCMYTVYCIKLQCGSKSEPLYGYSTNFYHRGASDARVIAIIVRPSVCLSVCHKPVLYQNG